jgi:hypothetical protein
LSYPQKQATTSIYPRWRDSGNRVLDTCFSWDQAIDFQRKKQVIHKKTGLLLLRLFFIRASKNNQTRSHAGSTRQDLPTGKTQVLYPLEPASRHRWAGSSEIGTSVSGNFPMAHGQRRWNDGDKPGCRLLEGDSCPQNVLHSGGQFQVRPMPACRQRLGACGHSKKFNLFAGHARAAAIRVRSRKSMTGKGNHEK